jgi:hypothetical protein
LCCCLLLPLAVMALLSVVVVVLVTNTNNKHKRVLLIEPNQKTSVSAFTSALGTTSRDPHHRQCHHGAGLAGLFHSFDLHCHRSLRANSGMTTTTRTGQTKSQMIAAYVPGTYYTILVAYCSLQSVGPTRYRYCAIPQGRTYSIFFKS